MRGLGFGTAIASQISAMDLTRIDLCWSAVAGLSMSEPIRGADFQTAGLLLALKAGEPSRIARALAMEAAIGRPAGTDARGLPALLTPPKRSPGNSIRHTSRDDRHGARRRRSHAQGQWKPAQTASTRPNSFSANHCTGVTWERDTVHNFVLWALIQQAKSPS